MTFTKTFVGFTEAGRFQPSEAHLEKLYDLNKLDDVTKEDAAARADAAAGMGFTEEDEEDSLGGDLDEDEDEDELGDKQAAAAGGGTEGLDAAEQEERVTPMDSI